MLQEYLEPFIDEKYPNGVTFQQDGAPAHRAKHTMDYFLTAGILDLPWPAVSPDMNCIEHLWGTLSLAVYESGRHYYCIEDLKESLRFHWDNISLEEIQALIGSMPRRIVALLNSKGKCTEY